MATRQRRNRANMPLNELRSMSFDDMRQHMNVNTSSEYLHLPRIPNLPRIRDIDSGTLSL